MRISEVSVATWNLFHGTTSSGTPKVRMEEFLEYCIRNHVHMVAMQEVPVTLIKEIQVQFPTSAWRSYHFHAHDCENFKKLGKEDGYLIFWDPTLVKLAPQNTFSFYEPHLFDSGASLARPPLYAKFDGVGMNSGSSFTFMTWHSDANRQASEAQISKLSNRISNNHDAYIIAGDLNIREQALKAVFKKWDALCDPKYRGEHGGGLDHILSNRRIQDGTAPDMSAFRSDVHYPVIGTVKIGERPRLALLTSMDDDSSVLLKITYTRRKPTLETSLHLNKYILTPSASFSDVNEERKMAISNTHISAKL